MKNEKWRDIKGFEGRYQISNHGRVRTISRILKPWNANGHYQNIYLGAKNLRRIHRLVAENFLPNPEQKQQVNHKDGNKNNNHATNLEWTTRAENIRHAYKNGFMKQAKLTTKMVKEIRASSSSKQELSQKYGVALHTIQRVRNNRTWKE